TDALSSHPGSRGVHSRLGTDVKAIGEYEGDGMFTTAFKAMIPPASHYTEEKCRNEMPGEMQWKGLPIRLAGTGGRRKSDFQPLRVEEARLVGTLVGMRAEIVTLGLEQVGGQIGSAVLIVIGKRRAEGRDGDPVEAGFGDGQAPIG